MRCAEMKLEIDCVRDILLAVEDASFDERMTLDWLSKKLPDWSIEELHYTCLKLGEGGLLDLMTIDPHMSYLPGIKVIISMTYQGHEFLSSIKSPTNWEKTKKIGGDVGAFGIKMAGKIAEGVATSFLKQQLLGIL